MYFFYNICYFSLLIQYVVDIACNVSYFPSLKVKADMIGTPWSGDVKSWRGEDGEIKLVVLDHYVFHIVCGTTSLISIIIVLAKSLEDKLGKCALKRNSWDFFWNLFFNRIYLTIVEVYINVYTLRYELRLTQTNVTVQKL